MKAHGLEPKSARYGAPELMTASAVPFLGDGRHARSESSRQRIIDALLHLVEQGDVSPGAAQVAEVAGVGLRTVFRHFQDMESLYAEMTVAVEARVRPLLAEPLAGADWKAQIYNMAERRATIFETILPYRVSANLRRFSSPYLMADYRRMLAMENGSVEAHVSPAVRADLVALRALCIALGFQTWRLLRFDHELSARQAKAVVRRMVDDALARHPD